MLYLIHLQLDTRTLGS